MTRILPAFAGGLATLASALAQDAAKPPPFQPPPADLSSPTLYVVGYAHLDTQWRWTYIDTIREYIPHTLHRNFALFEKHPNYIFNFSGSRRYRMMEEYYPADFAKLKGYVAAGRWFPCGSSVDENDANVPSAESLVRQVLYGNTYFRQTFGVASEEFMLPDCFGFPAALPSVLAHSGVKGFSTQKLTWNAVVPIPFKVGVWEGPDGSSVTAALDPGAYVFEIKDNLAESNAWLNRIKGHGEKSGVFADYHYYGVGDQGGAPTERSVVNVEKSLATQGPVKVISSAADWLFKAITPEQRAKLPTYKGELELTEHSAGSITSQAYMKRWNRKNELLADASEKASVGAWLLGGRPYPGRRIEDAWYLVLGSQMHDILPGTSVPKAYDLSWNDEVLAANQFAGVLTDAAAVVSGQMDTTAKGTPVVVFNPLAFDREEIVEAEVPARSGAEGVRVFGTDGAAIPAQVVHSDAVAGVARVIFQAKVPSVGFAAFDVQLSGTRVEAPARVRTTEHELENQRYTVRIDDNGDVASVYDKRHARELLSAPARLGLHYENPAQWPAWNQDWNDRQKPAKAYVGGPATIQVVEDGPIRACVEVRRECEGSFFSQRIRLGSGPTGDRVEFETDIDWRTRERSLRAAFPLAVSSPAAAYDMQTGVIERGNGTAKQFEYAFHQWFDVTGETPAAEGQPAGEYGVSVLCDSKYGADKPDDGTVRLTLLHTPGTRGGYADQGTQDLGRHRVLYALYGHDKDWAAGGTPQQAARLNQPLVPFVVPSHEGGLGKSVSLLRVSNPNVAVIAMKKAEQGDEVIIRLRELSGQTATGVKISAGRPIAAAREVDGQERETGPATVQGAELVTDVRGFGLRAFALRLVETPDKKAPAPGTAVALRFDTDAASTNANRADGNLDGKGATLPAEQLPANVTAEGVEFTLGPTADGQKNALACAGQTLEIPAGADRLSILAAATGGRDISAFLEIDGKATPWRVQSWTGYLGQWDHRLWRSEMTGASAGGLISGGDLAGLEPGYIKPDHVAWHASHHHTPRGDAIYEYCYLYRYDFDLTPEARAVKLPNDPSIKVFAATASTAGPARARPAAPLFDTLTEHQQDAPLFNPPSGSFTDAAEVRIEPRLYWRADAVRYTTDGTNPTAQSPQYRGPIIIAGDSTLKAAIVKPDGSMGPAATATYSVRDATAPALKSASGLHGAACLWVSFSEPLGASSLDPSRFTLEPAVAVLSVQPGADPRSVLINLASPPESGKPYRLVAKGIQDTAPTPNTLADGSAEFTVQGPVYTLDEVTRDHVGKSIADVPGLPVKSKDPWTLNLFVRTPKQPPSHTVFAGFGRCADTLSGGGRYLCKFANGVHFWARGRDVEGRTPLELNTWQMLTATYDGTTLRLYKDAAKLAERTVTLANDDNIVWIAPKDPWDQRYQFEGELRAVSIWSTALSEEALAALRASTKLP